MATNSFALIGTTTHNSINYFNEKKNAIFFLFIWFVCHQYCHRKWWKFCIRDSTNCIQLMQPRNEQTKFESMDVIGFILSRFGKRSCTSFFSVQFFSFCVEIILAWFATMYLYAVPVLLLNDHGDRQWNGQSQN